LVTGKNVRHDETLHPANLSCSQAGILGYAQVGYPSAGKTIIAAGKLANSQARLGEGFNYELSVGGDCLRRLVVTRFIGSGKREQVKDRMNAVTTGDR
jgi:hypothetical protein